jgi:hypothetical protein
LRDLGLVRDDRLELTADGIDVVQGVGDAPKLEDGDWTVWNAGFSRASGGIGKVPVGNVRERICREMPRLDAALRAVRWRIQPAWALVAGKLGEDAAYARFAHRFLSWSSEVKRSFDRMLEGRSARCPSIRLKPPAGLSSWEELAQPFAARLGRREPVGQVLAAWHRHVYTRRGYGDGDLLAVWEDGRLIARPPSMFYLSDSEPQERDCRWSNAVAVMRPR